MTVITTCHYVIQTSNKLGVIVFGYVADWTPTIILESSWLMQGEITVLMMHTQSGGIDNVVNRE